MTEEIKIGKKDVAACNYWKACDYYKQLKSLKQENKELKKENIKVKKEFNNLITEIISDIEYTSEITCNSESPRDHLHQMQKALSALEEIREIADDTFSCCDDDCGNARKIKLIINKINEVLE